MDDLRLVVGTHDGILKGQVNIGEVFVLHTHPTFKSVPEHFALDLEKASGRMEGVLDWNNQMTLFNKDGIVNSTNPLDGSLNGLSPYHDIPFMNEAGDIVGFQKVEILADGSGGLKVSGVDDLKHVDDGRNITGGGDDYARAISGGDDWSNVLGKITQDQLDVLRGIDPSLTARELEIILDKLDYAFAKKLLEQSDDLLQEMVRDSNLKLPLSMQNARKILFEMAPDGFMPKEIAGQGGAGADVIFESLENAADIFRIENKCIVGGPNSFSTALSHAVKKQTANLVFIQVSDGADVSSWLAKFWGRRSGIITSTKPKDIAKMKRYKETEIIIMDVTGNILLNRQPIYNP